jgi:hypothetical protein
MDVEFSRHPVPIVGFRWAFGDAHTAVDAFVGMNDEHVFAFIEAIDRAYFHAIGVFAFDAIVGDDIGHGAVASGFLRPPG